jgi:predicted flap endonuclease-1-like 5' DNA nuclease
MNQSVIIVVAVIVVIALLLLFVVRGRKQHVTFNDSTALPRTAKPAAPVVTGTPVEGHGVTDEATAAIEDVVDQFIGLDAHPSGRPAEAAAAATGDTLTTLKGLGPKAASRLAELGVTSFDQIASWNAKEVEAMDAQMGAFKGRILRDRWVDQAKLLAAGDVAGFEEKFGKLGG